MLSNSGAECLKSLGGNFGHRVVFGAGTDALNRALISASKEIVKAAFGASPLDKATIRARVRIDFREGVVSYDGRKVVTRGVGANLIWHDETMRSSS